MVSFNPMWIGYTSYLFVEPDSQWGVPWSVWWHSLFHFVCCICGLCPSNSYHKRHHCRPPCTCTSHLLSLWLIVIPDEVNRDTGSTGNYSPAQLLLKIRHHRHQHLKINFKKRSKEGNKFPVTPSYDTLWTLWVTYLSPGNFFCSMSFRLKYMRERPSCLPAKISLSPKSPELYDSVSDLKNAQM